MKYAIIISAVAVLGVAILVPAIKGPINRWRLTANDKLNQEYVVDNLKAEYVKLHEKKAEAEKTLRDMKIKNEVCKKKLAEKQQCADAAKGSLVAIGTSDMAAFIRAKNAYEKYLVEVKNLKTQVECYSNAVVQLDMSLASIESNMSKAQHNIDILSAKKDTLDTVKSVNEIIENIKGTGESELAVNVEKINEDFTYESIKNQVLNNEKTSSEVMTETEAKAYIQNLK